MSGEQRDEAPLSVGVQFRSVEGVGRICLTMGGRAVAYLARGDAQLLARMLRNAMEEQAEHAAGAAS